MNIKIHIQRRISPQPVGLASPFLGGSYARQAQGWSATLSFSLYTSNHNESHSSALKSLIIHCASYAGEPYHATFNYWKVRFTVGRWLSNDLAPKPHNSTCANTNTQKHTCTVGNIHSQENIEIYYVHTHRETHTAFVTPRSQSEWAGGDWTSLW